MKIIKTIPEMQEIVSSCGTIGFVPTMGYLHEAHLSLMRKAREENDIVVLSIYVNPTQFNNPEDLEKYPRDFERDEKLAEKEGVDYIFYPDDKEMYPQGMKYLDYRNKFMDGLCGSSRPKHFEGVITIVAKLFDIIKPTKTYFGQKDYQQSLIVKQMIKDLNYNIEFVMCPLIREEDGVAMSSRNAMLTAGQREKALVLNKSLLLAKEFVENGEKDVAVLKKDIEKVIGEADEAKVDYIEIRNAETLEPVDKIEGKVVIALAVFFGIVRLIDNVVVEK